MEENTIQRIKRYIDYKGVKVSAFERKIGMSNGSFASQLKNNKTIGVDKLENILRIYPDIDVVWLLTGKGDFPNANVLSEASTVYNKTSIDNPDLDINYKELAEARKETIESLKKVILYLEAQLAARNKK